LKKDPYVVRILKNLLSLTKDESGTIVDNREWKELKKFTGERIIYEDEPCRIEHKNIGKNKVKMWVKGDGNERNKKPIRNKANNG